MPSEESGGGDRDEQSTVKAYQCRPCGEVFQSRADALEHVNRHRTKPYQKISTGAKKRVSEDDLIREIDVEPDSSEAKSLHEIAGEPEPDDSEPEYLTENEPPETEPRQLWEWSE